MVEKEVTFENIPRALDSDLAAEALILKNMLVVS